MRRGNITVISTGDFLDMRKLMAAASVAAIAAQCATPAAARDFFDRNTLLGYRQQTGPAAVAYFRAPIGPRTFKAPVRTGFAVVGPRSYSAGEAPLYSQGPRLVDFAFTNRGVDARWARSFSVGGAVAWTSDPESLPKGQLNLMESGVSWVAVGAIAAGLLAGTIALIEKEGPAPAQ